LGLLDRQPQVQRNFRSGRVGNFNQQWETHQVMPRLFKINDATLEQPALEVIRRVLVEPTAEDTWRRTTPGSPVEGLQDLTSLT
jgi:hypothetical protein